MKSAVFYGKHDLRVEDSTKPTVGKRDVLINVKACGVCGTDVHIYEGDKGAADVTPPTILGHEFAGVVEAVGSDVTGFKPGDRVCIDPNHPCGCCEPCRDGINHYCEHMTGYGTTVNGGFAEYCSVDMQQVYKLGDHTSFEQGAMTEPVACCLHGIDMCNIKPGSTVVVIGGGHRIFMGPEESMQIQANLGSTIAMAFDECVENPAQHDYSKASCERTTRWLKRCKDEMARLKQEGVGNVDVVIECVGKPITIEQAIQIAGHKATVMMFGLTKPDETITVKPFEVFQKELVLTSSYINPYTQRRALELIDSGRLDVSSMVAKVASLDELGAILSDPVLRATGKYIIDPSK